MVIIAPAMKVRPRADKPTMITIERTVAPTNLDTKFIIQTLILRSKERFDESISSLFHGRKRVLANKSSEKYN
ncbi:MAG: hypothetical protein WC451_05065 [Patescibacteria group bacterium]